VRLPGKTARAMTQAAVPWQTKPWLPVMSVAFGIALFSLMDAAMKGASLAAGVYTALLLRNLIGTALVLPVWLARRGRWPVRSVLAVHALRSAVVAGMALLFFYGLVRLPMAEGIALSFIAPLIALYLAALVLGEAVRRSAAFASLLCLTGVAVIAATRLGDGGEMSASPDGIVAILLSAVLYAVNLVLQRRQAQIAEPIEIAVFQNLLVALVLLPAAPWFLAAPTTAAVVWAAISAVLASCALLLFAWGYARAQAQVLLPIEYTAFFWSALFGWLFFGEALGIATIFGAALIVGGCLIAARPDRTATPHVPAP
jgi:S-adenosylmethionine uptake transporter